MGTLLAASCRGAKLVSERAQPDMSIWRTQPDCRLSFPCCRPTCLATALALHPYLYAAITLFTAVAAARRYLHVVAVTGVALYLGAELT